MKKLQLIKPWRLRATRLKLADVRGEDDEIIYQAASAAPETNVTEALEVSCFAVTGIRAVAFTQAAHNMVCTPAPGHHDCYTPTAQSVR